MEIPLETFAAFVIHSVLIALAHLKLSVGLAI